MRNPILERKIVPVTHPTANQKAVLAKIISAATPQLASADISDTPNLAAARDMLEKMGLISLDSEGAHLTDAGHEVLVNQNLATQDGQLTDDGQKAAYGENKAADAAEPEGNDLELGFGDDGGEGDAFSFGDEGDGEDDFSFGDEDELDTEFGDDEEDLDGGKGNKRKRDVGADEQKKLHAPLESYSLLSDLRENVIFESLNKFIPKDLLSKLSRDEVQQLMRVLTDRDDIMHHHNLYKKLYYHFVNDMPYGTAKGRTGDPAEWLLNRLQTGIESGRHNEDDPRSDR